MEDGVREVERTAKVKRPPGSTRDYARLRTRVEDDWTSSDRFYLEKKRISIRLSPTHRRVRVPSSLFFSPRCPIRRKIVERRMAANDTGPLPLLSSFLSATEEEEEEEEGKEEEIPRGRFYEARSTAGKKRHPSE